MKFRTRLSCILIALFLVSVPKTQAQSLRLEHTVPLPGVEGRFDHFALDGANHRLYVAALGNNTVEIIDTSRFARLASIEHLDEPQGVAYAPDLDRLFVANGESAVVDVFDGKMMNKVAAVEVRPDPDNLRYDPKSHRIYVGHGVGKDGAIGVIDAASATLLQNISFEGHPESFQLEADGPHIYVNVPDTRRVMVIDRDAAKVVGAWSLHDVRSNFPMALDETHHRLIIGCREPARMIVFDIATGAVVDQEACVRDADDIFYNAAAKRVYVSGGGGAITVFQQSGPDRYDSLGDVPTATGARTSYFDPENAMLFLAVPHRTDQDAAIRVYATDRAKK